MVLSHEHDTALERARIRAEARGITANVANEESHGAERVYFLRAGSFSHAGVEHGVKLAYDATGVTAICSCEGGQSGRICQHLVAAMAAVEAGISEPEPPAAISRGAAALELLNGDDADYVFGRTA